jgi:hypothetical protein
VTFEAAPVLEFAVAAEAATIAYVVDDPAGGDRRTLVLLDGGGRRERLYEKISGVAISPDGSQVVYRLDSPAPGLIIGSDESPSGVWSSLPAGPGRPSLGTPDVPADGVYDGDAPAWSYTPLGWSPDGSRLALVAYDADGPGIPGGEVAIFPREGREPVRGPTCCEWPAWSADGTALHSAGGGPGPDVRYGLYRLDTGTGAETPVIEQAPDGPIPLVTAPRQLADGELYAFVELAPADGFSWEYRFRPRLSRVGAGGDVTPLAAPVGAPVAVLWDQDARGAVVAPVGEAGVEPLAWVPADGSAIVALDATGVALAWAAVPVAEGDCSVFTGIGYQQPASRQFSAEARDVQARLAALGFEPGAADGFFGDQTRAAVVAFQRDRGLDATGDVNCATWQALLAGRP